ncbi:uncharacterized protein E5676_scaffold121G00600 [Cucumis melo var. makuwa]|uniref:Envelope-like protein n=1 Tax=Cucumis melo var. makuwa TaxID=1194695 RepID=A0A5D3BWJ8_CUCMM|nr:uncharacterized protein E6C27_scaffold269G001450 [Cucumis melo var. makuwa]TYK03455.1 uncharacterized protein E5676_scaffold121G00600 [Cucumis melo var. makuwa]
MFVHNENVVSISAKNVESESIVFESHMSEMDSDERDDVSLARLLKKGLFSKVKTRIIDAPVHSVDYDGSYSSEDVFVPASGQPSTTNENIEQSGHSPHATDNVGENIVDNVGENLDENVGEHVKPTDNSAPDDVEPNVNVPQTEFEQPHVT